MRLCGGENERDPGGRLFKGFQQGVEGLAREHVGFVDNKYLEPPFKGRIADIFLKALGVVNAAVGGPVNFLNVNGYSLCDLAAAFTLVAGLGSRPPLAVERFGENAGDCGFANPPGAGEKIGRSHLSFRSRARQNRLGRGLARHLGKQLRTVFGSKGK